LKRLYGSYAGPWPYYETDANVVPVVANGKVYIASYQMLMIFGAGGKAVPIPTAVPDAITHRLPQGVLNRVTGVLLSADGALLTLRTRTGRSVKVNGEPAMTNRRTGILLIGNSYTALSSGVSVDGIQQAVAIARAKRATKAWPPDQ